MNNSMDRGVTVSRYGIENGYRCRHYYTGLAKRKGNLAHVVVYCPDMTKRKLLDHINVRIEPPYWSLILMNGFFSGIPVLSEPVGTYELRELKLLVAKSVHRRRHSLVLGGPELLAQLEAATTFDDLLDIVYPDPKARAESPKD